MNGLPRNTPPIASLHIIGGKKLGGAERFFVRLVNALSARGCRVGVVAVAGGEIESALAPNVIRHPAPLAGVWDFYSRWRIHHIAQGYDLVQTYMGRATRLTHLPCCRSPVHIARLGGYYNLKGYRHAHAWVGNTLGIRDYLIQEGLPADRVFYIGNFVDPSPALPAETLEGMRRQWGIPADARVVLGLGRLHPNKGFTDLLDAFAGLPARLHDQPLWLVMAGDGPLGDELRAQASRLGIAERVTWAGWQYDPAPCFQMAAVFACPSRHEPLGNVILEAWANRVPVVSAAAQGPVELIADGVDGMLAPLADARGLGERLLASLNLSQEARAAMTAAGQSKVDSRFSEQAIVEAYLEMYRGLTTRA